MKRPIRKFLRQLVALDVKCKAAVDIAKVNGAMKADKIRTFE